MKIGKTLRTLVILLSVATKAYSQSPIYTTEVLPSFSLLSNGGFCVSNEDNELFGDTTLTFPLLTDGMEGYVYYAYSSVGGGITSIGYEQTYEQSLVSYDNYIFPSLDDTVFITFNIQGNNIESFCPFFIAFNPLPVVWGDNNVEQIGNDVLANAVTLSEANAHYISFQVSNDLEMWKDVSMEQMHNNSSNINVYTFVVNVEQMREYIPRKAGGIYDFSTQTQTFPVVLYGRFVQYDYNGMSMNTEPKSFVLRLNALYGKILLENYDVSGRKMK